MTLPIRAVAQSGYGGRGYRPFGHKVPVQPSVTTILKAEAKPALTQWAADQTAAYAVANAEKLFGMSDSRAWGFLRYFWNRAPKDPLSGDIDLASYHTGVLSDAGELGDSVHEWIEADLFQTPFPDVSNRNPAFWECVAAWNKFKSEHDIVPHRTEVTVWNDEPGMGHGGTFDILAEVDGKLMLIDIKTSRGLYTSTWMQLSALYHSPILLEPDPTVDDPRQGVDRLLSNWQAPIEGVAVIHVRPGDFENRTGKPMEPFAKWVPIPLGKEHKTWQEATESYYKGFRGLRAYVEAMKEVAA